MEDMSQANSITDPGLMASALARLLENHKGNDVLVLDLREMNAWTDFFVIATVTSKTHLQGLERHIKDFSLEKGMEIIRRSRRPDGEDDEWCLIDMGPVVVHLMTEQTRSFYELERLWASQQTVSEAR
jgi:ribosome-associated protein